MRAISRACVCASASESSIPDTSVSFRFSPSPITRKTMWTLSISKAVQTLIFLSLAEKVAKLLRYYHCDVN